MSIKSATIPYPNLLKMWYNIIVSRETTKSTEMKGFVTMNQIRRAVFTVKNKIDFAEKNARPHEGL